MWSVKLITCISFFLFISVGAGCNSSSNKQLVERYDEEPQGGDECVTGVTDGFGLAGEYEVAVDSFPHPSNILGTVTVFSPIIDETPTSGLPVIFFSHAFASTNVTTYQILLEFLASQGYVVVHSPYQITSSFELLSLNDVPKAYDELWDGFSAAVDNFAEKLSMDLHRVGFIGHSFGGGATPAMLTRGLNEGWGSISRFALILAPFKVFEITSEEFATIPSDTHVVIHIYEEDDTNDHNFAIKDIWEKLENIPLQNKDFLILPTASEGNCTLPSDHGVPMETGGRYGKTDAYDLWAVRRHAAAISQCTFENDATACQIAMGHGDARQSNMGFWVESGDPLPAFASTIPPVALNCKDGNRCTFTRKTDN